MYDDPELGPVPDGMDLCDYCLGAFFPEDMDGDHCHECHDIVFAEDIP